MQQGSVRQNKADAGRGQRIVRARSLVQTAAAQTGRNTKFAVLPPFCQIYAPHRGGPNAPDSPHHYDHGLPDQSALSRDRESSQTVARTENRQRRWWKTALEL